MVSWIIYGVMWSEVYTEVSIGWKRIISTFSNGIFEVGKGDSVLRQLVEFRNFPSIRIRFSSFPFEKHRLRKNEPKAFDERDSLAYS